MKYISDISTRAELADFLNIPIRSFTHMLYIEKPDSFYTSFEIKKKSGGVRQINTPSEKLMNIQRKIAVALWEYEKVIREKKQIQPNISHAFEKDKSIITNAKIHRNKRIVLNIDLKDFFPSIHFGRVKGFFKKNNDYHLPLEVATILAQLSCYKGTLPQGAPTSPIISNLICKILDMRLLKLANNYKVDYTRYADDLTFSTNNKDFLDKQNDFLEKITCEIIRAGFSINEKKTRTQLRNSKQEVTGIIVNKKLNVDRNYYKQTRAMAESLYTKGEFFINDEKGSLKQLEGRFSFINQIDKYNNKLDIKSPFIEIMQTGRDDKYRRFKVDSHTHRNLNGREEQYRKFLFYKYFYANHQPLIITEGKTDIIYLKAALMNRYNDYPNLIEKCALGYNFKISFFRRTKRIEYFLDIVKDGADVMKKIYNYFSDSNKGDTCKNYYRCIFKKTSITPTNPVIFIFDNEQKNKDKPLKNFSNYVELNKEQEKFITSGGYCRLNINAIKKSNNKDTKEKNKNPIEKFNLYLLTHQLIDGKEECEIEDLFDKETLNHKEGERSFSRKDENKEKYYNKDIFSKYILSNYKKIDFTNFKPLLDNLNNIINEFHSSFEIENQN